MLDNEHEDDGGAEHLQRAVKKHVLFHAHKVAEAELKPDGKHQKYYAKLGKLRHMGVFDATKDVNLREANARDYVADDGWNFKNFKNDI